MGGCFFGFSLPTITLFASFAGENSARWFFLETLFHILSLQRMRQSASLKRHQYVADRRRKGGMVALSQTATFLAVEHKQIYGDMVTPCSAKTWGSK